MIAVLLSAAACQLGGGGAFTLPDDRPQCTPGQYNPAVTKTIACTKALHPRGPVTASLRRRVLARYGMTPEQWMGHDGEIDHRVSVWASGASTVENLWPQLYPEAKDDLEKRLWRRVCLSQPHPMRVSTAVAVFTGNWVDGYAKYVGPVR
jgi:hypothetical protein